MAWASRTSHFVEQVQQITEVHASVALEIHDVVPVHDLFDENPVPQVSVVHLKQNATLFFHKRRGLTPLVYQRVSLHLEGL